MAHVHAARAVLPGMLARGGGALLQTASAAGLLSQIGAAPYAVTKHAVVALAEWLAMTYGDRGIRVSCLCPMGVQTPMLSGDDVAIRSVIAAGKTVTPEEVAEAVVQGLGAERFWILPHPEVAEFVRRKAADIDGWLAAMRRFQARLG
jgi:NAD(P)-dependent dehydrogenase (short-subunit alcohol dehydrogenase family)